MMKLCLLSLSFKRSFAAGAMDIWSFLDVARDLGFDGVDLHALGLPSDDDRVLDKVADACLDRGLSIPCVSIGNTYAGPVADLHAQVAMTHRWIRAAARLKAPQVRVFAGTAEPGDESAGWTRCVAALRQSGAFGAELGVRVSLQNHNHRQIARTGDDVQRMLADVGHRNMGHVLDCGQYAGSPGASGFAEDPDRGAYDYLASIEQTAPLATHVRAKIYEMHDGRETSLDYERIFRALRGVSYNGWVSLVYEGRGDEHADIAAAIPMLRRFMATHSTPAAAAE
ncbi:MAG: sugar phosphate isomerase/epimerase [Chloroflexi bacterium]|nr:sugar phosphate isomerase/epimerase [Chloroflexota bacterium]